LVYTGEWGTEEILGIVAQNQLTMPHDKASISMKKPKNSK
jgi:hypothetical protein